VRVLHVASGDVWGGAEQVVAMLLSGARDVGVSGEALLFNEGRLAETLRGLGVAVHVIPERKHSFLELVLRVRRWMRWRGIDVVHAHRYKETFAAVLARRVGTGLVVTVHGLQPRAQLGGKALLLNWSSLLAARLSGARLVGVSQELTDRIATRLGRQAVVHIPNPMPAVCSSGGDPDLRSRLGWDQRRPVVGFVGRLEDVKGPQHFIDLAGRSRGDTGFVLIGSGSLEGVLAARVEAERLSKRVAFLGEVADATSYLRQLDVLVLPSRHEGLPLILLEAAACRTPVVAFNVGGVSEVLDNSPAARLVTAGDASALQNAVEVILEDREEVRKEAAKWGRVVESRYNPTGVLTAYAAVYHLAARQSHLLGDPRASP
jgi:L-malate glycosyltransferase